MRTLGLTLGSFLFLAMSLGASEADAAKWRFFSRAKKEDTAVKKVETRVPPPPTVTVATPLVRHEPTPPPKPVITSATVNGFVLAARSARFTAGFDAAFKTAVGQIHELAKAGQLEAAQNAAVEALHSYMDHHRLEPGNFPASQRFFIRTYATQAGLNDILMF